MFDLPASFDRQPRGFSSDLKEVMVIQELNLCAALIRKFKINKTVQADQRSRRKLQRTFIWRRAPYRRSHWLAKEKVSTSVSNSTSLRQIFNSQ
jgi:hypothetical protein